MIYRDQLAEHRSLYNIFAAASGGGGKGVKDFLKKMDEQSQ